MQVRRRLLLHLALFGWRSQALELAAAVAHAMMLLQAALRLKRQLAAHRPLPAAI
jgi:hypothetical protein